MIKLQFDRKTKFRLSSHYFSYKYEEPELLVIDRHGIHLKTKKINKCYFGSFEMK